MKIIIYLLVLIFTPLIKVISFFRRRAINRLQKAVKNYEIVEKYHDDPKWAIRLYFDNGSSFWNETIPGSFMAKDPDRDLTFVFLTEKEALDYAEDMFSDATLKES